MNQKPATRWADVSNPACRDEILIYSFHAVVENGTVYDFTAPLDTIVELALTFPAAREIKVRGKVVWENAGNAPGRPMGVGVRFSNLAAPDREFIKGFIANVGRA